MKRVSDITKGKLNGDDDVSLIVSWYSKKDEKTLKKILIIKTPRFVHSGNPFLIILSHLDAQKKDSVWLSLSEIFESNHEQTREATF